MGAGHSQRGLQLTEECCIRVHTTWMDTVNRIKPLGPTELFTGSDDTFFARMSSNCMLITYQDFVWGELFALFLTKKADDLFLVVALKERLNTPPNLTCPAKTVL